MRKIFLISGLLLLAGILFFCSKDIARHKPVLRDMTYASIHQYAKEMKDGGFLEPNERLSLPIPKYDVQLKGVKNSTHFLVCAENCINYGEAYFCIECSGTCPAVPCPACGHVGLCSVEWDCNLCSEGGF